MAATKNPGLHTSRIIRPLGGRQLSDCRWEIWGGILVRLRSSRYRTRYTWRPIGEHYGTGGDTLGQVLSHVAEFRRGRMDEWRLKLTLCWAYDSRKGPEGFHIVWMENISNRGCLGYWTPDDATTWSLAVGFLCHGNWRPLVDHLIETDQGFAGAWQEYLATRATKLSP
jgi:hypothetical protein